MDAFNLTDSLRIQQWNKYASSLYFERDVIGEFPYPNIHTHTHTRAYAAVYLIKYGRFFSRCSRTFAICPSLSGCLRLRALSEHKMCARTTKLQMRAKSFKHITILIIRIFILLFFFDEKNIILYDMNAFSIYDGIAHTHTHTHTVCILQWVINVTVIWNVIISN